MIFLLGWCLAFSPSSEGPAVDLGIQIRYELVHNPGGGFEVEEVNREVRIIRDPEAKWAWTMSLVHTRYAPATSRETLVNGVVKQVASEVINPEFRDQFLSDTELVINDFRAEARPGDSIELRYHRRYPDPVHLPILEVPFRFNVSHYRIVWHHPPEIKVDFECFFPYEPIPMKVTRPEAGQTILDLEPGLTTNPALSYMPFSARAYIISVLTGPAGTRIDRGSKEQFFAWYKGQIDQLDPLSPSSKAGLEKLLPLPFAEGMDPLPIIHRSVAENIRYIADERSLGAFIPRAPDEVLARMYGDCKDRALLVASIARRFDRQVHMALVSTEFEPLFSSVHLHRFNHVINAFEHNGQWRFADPTQPEFSFGALPEVLQGKPVLILGKEPVTTQIPLESGAPLVELHLHLKPGQSGPMIGQATFHRDFAAALLESAQRNAEAFADTLAKIVASVFPQIQVVGATQREMKTECVRLELLLEQSGLLVETRTRLYLPGAPFHVFDQDLLARRHDAFPVYVNFRPNYRLVLELDHPGYAGDGLPPGTDLGQDAFGYQVEMQASSAAHSRIVYSLFVKEKIFDHQAKEDLIGWTEQYLALRAKRIRFQGQ